ncbi:MAG: sugar phosphate isomerase/epimerase family protein [Bryobacterales bacterium]|nr:sugar phosphate isomerase/epimerase family protein [Bryobacterales bacterium]
MPIYTPVLHSVSYSSAWPGQAFLPIPDFLRKARELGYGAVALVAKEPHLSPASYSKQERRELRARILDEGLILSALMGYTDFTCGMRRPGIPSAEMNALYVAQLCELCADLGCSSLRVFTGYRLDELTYDLQYREVVRGLRLAGEYAKESGVTLLLQNHHDIAAHYKEFAWLLRELDHPQIKAAFDCWAVWLQGARTEQLRQAVRELAPWLAFTTVADYKVMPQFTYRPDQVNYAPCVPALVRATAPGEGELDYDSFFAGLKDAGYRGPVAYEMCAPLEGGGSVGNLDRTARIFLEFLTRHESSR